MKKLFLLSKFSLSFLFVLSVGCNKDRVQPNFSIIITKKDNIQPRFYWVNSNRNTTPEWRFVTLMSVKDSVQ